MSNDKKKEILEMLARKEISKEEAERKLAEMGETVSEPEPVQEPQQVPKKGKTGCLIAVIIAVVLLPILLVILTALFVLLMKGDSGKSYEPYRVEMKDSTSSSDSPADEGKVPDVVVPETK